MITLETVAGVEARIFTLQDRPPFMVAADLAEVYGTEPRYINRAVTRNPERFPEDFCFRLSDQENLILREKWCHLGTTSQGSRTDQAPLVFTHAGAYALSAVLKTPVAAAVSVIIHRAFAAMEARALKEAQLLLFKIQQEAMMRKPSRVVAVNGVAEGMSFGQILNMTSASGPKLARTLRELKMLGLIGQLPEGTPDENQIDLFSREA